MWSFVSESPSGSFSYADWMCCSQPTNTCWMCYLAIYAAVFLLRNRFGRERDCILRNRIGRYEWGQHCAAFGVFVSFPMQFSTSMCFQLSCRCAGTQARNYVTAESKLYAQNAKSWIHWSIRAQKVFFFFVVFAAAAHLPVGRNLHFAAAAAALSLIINNAIRVCVFRSHIL